MTNENYQLIAMQAMIPGMTFGIEQSLKVLNEARTALGQPPLALIAREQPEPVRRQKPESVNWTPEKRKEASARAKRAWRAKKKATEKTTPVRKSLSLRNQIGSSTRADWARAKAAGLHPVTRPSREMLIKADRILQQRKAS